MDRLRPEDLEPAKAAFNAAMKGPPTMEDGAKLYSQAAADKSEMQILYKAHCETIQKQLVVLQVKHFEGVQSWPVFAKDVAQDICQVKAKLEGAKAERDAWAIARAPRQKQNRRQC